MLLGASIAIFVASKWIPFDPIDEADHHFVDVLLPKIVQADRPETTPAEIEGIKASTLDQMRTRTQVRWEHAAIWLLAIAGLAVFGRSWLIHRWMLNA
jgi:hypothetical protein